MARLGVARAVLVILTSGIFLLLPPALLIAVIIRASLETPTVKREFAKYLTAL